MLLLDQDPRFEMSSIEEPCKPVLDFDADLFERTLKVLVSILDFMRIVSSHPDIVEKTTGL